MSVFLISIQRGTKIIEKWLGFVDKPMVLKKISNIVSKVRLNSKNSVDLL